jgi:hypothetical protein
MCSFNRKGLFPEEFLPDDLDIRTISPMDPDEVENR